MANGGRTVTSQLARSEVQIQSHLAAAGVRLKLSASSYVDLIGFHLRNHFFLTLLSTHKDPYGFGFLKLIVLWECSVAYMRDSYNI